MKKFILILFSILSFYLSKAQVINVCASDSVTLTVENYFSGIVEWQESIDNDIWVNIPEVSGILYKFHPVQSKYYRAVVKTSGCNPLYSAVSFVQLPPVAHAGEDRVIGNTSVTLLGNMVQGATGVWSILSGNGGVLDDPSKARATLTGKSKESYKLKWTLTNACGQSSDTVLIVFDEITVKKNFIVVDKTDKLLSDSTEMANGTYRIKFSDPTIAPYDSVMLIGMRDDFSFLKIVTGFTQKDSVFSFSTVQGSLEDLIQSGVLNLGDAVNQAMIGDTAHYKNSIAFPTRETLKNITSKNGVELIYTKSFRDGNNNTLKSVATSSNPGGFKLSIPDITIADNSGTLKYSIKDSYIKIDPNFVMDYHYKFPAKLTDLKFGIDNGTFEYNYKTVLEGSVPFNFVKDKQTLLDFRQDMIIIVMGVPILLTTHIKCNASCNIGISTALKIEQTKHYKKYLTALVTGDNVNNLSFNVNTNDETTVDDKMVIKGKLNAEVKIGPEISFTVYDVAGPYINVPLKLNTGICVNSDGNWDSETSLGIEGNIGAKGEIKALGATLTLFDFNYPLFDKIYLGSYKMPYQLELLSGNFQSGIAGTKLTQPISVKVTNNHGSGIPLVPVRFELDNGNGSVSDPMLYTDSQGIVKTDWTLGTNPNNILKVRVLNCSNSDIDNSPLIISANSTTLPNNCTNSNLAINIRSASGNTYPSASGGKGPYTYSVNGVDYSSTIPLFPDNIPIKKLVYVKDNNQCVRTKTININPLDPCANSTLFLEALIQPNILTLTGKLGTAPYTFSVDNATSFTGIKIYNKLSVGKHIAYVKDASGCIYSKEIVIDPPTTNSISASYPVSGANTVPVSGITFKWVAGSYATNQVYDLYLKKDNAAYSLIASDLNTTSYTYTTLLANNGKYTWKVAVKGTNGVIDFSEFTFTSANGVAVVPTGPVLLQPANNATSVVFPVTLKWTAQTGDFAYDVYLDTLDGSKLVALNLATAEYSVDNLESGKKYYWKVKVKSTVTGQSAISNVWSFTTPGNTTVTDIDGNVYHTVTIGSQVWMVENLKTTKLNDGTPISNIADNTDWSKLTSPGYCWPLNIVNNKTVYGALYNLYTVNTGKLCPTGWHVSTDAEWTTLINLLGGESVAGGKLKEIGTAHWRITNTGVTNETGFTALPGGVRDTKGAFGDFLNVGFWWTSTEVTSGNGNYIKYLFSVTSSALTSGYTPTNGLSVRCVKDNANYTPITLNTTSANYITSISAMSGGNVINDSGSPITTRGVCWSTTQNPTISNSKTTDSLGVGSFVSKLIGLTENTTYYVRAYATNSTGTYYGNQVSFKTHLSVNPTGTFTDSRDNKTYKWVQIGTQTWMAENLAYLPSVTYRDTRSETIPYNYVYLSPGGNVTDAKATLSYLTYGVLYNWEAAKIAPPPGWHLPTDDEWKILEQYLGMNPSGSGNNDIVGAQLRSTSGWSNKGNGNNSSGFNALPGGFIPMGGGYYYQGSYAYFWTSSPSTSTYAWFRFLNDGVLDISRTDYSRSQGLSVRCVKD